MAMSLKKIGAIAVGGAMLASALASGAMAAEVMGDVKAFKFVEDGKPAVDIVVGEDAATMDVVSAADIAAKIGSMCFKTGAVEDGSAELNVHVVANTNKHTIANMNPTAGTGNDAILFKVVPDTDYAVGSIMEGAVALDGTATAGADILDDLPTLTKLDDIDPKDIYDTTGAVGTINYYNMKSDDAVEIGLYRITDDGVASDKVAVDYIGYASVVTEDGKFDVTDAALRPGILIPFMGETYMVVDVDDNDDKIVLGKLVYDGILKEGETYSLEDGYEIKCKAVLKDINTNNPKADIQILKNGKVVDEKFDLCLTDITGGKVSQLILYDGKVGVVAVNAYTDVGGNEGYVDLYIVKDIKELKLGEEIAPDWKVYGVVHKGAAGAGNGDIVISKDKDIDANLKLDDDTGTKSNIVGIAIVNDLDPTKSDNQLDKDDTLPALNSYFELEVADLDMNSNSLGEDFKIRVISDVTKDVTLNIGQKEPVLNAEIKLKDIKADAQQSVPITAPIAKLDSEVSLDTADKNLILVGGPVVNKLTKALVDEGKISIDNDSPATIAVVEDAANGHDVLVVAGGDRDKTREAAKELIEML
jgi:S-layer protein (TIGR01564 family)